MNSVDSILNRIKEFHLSEVDPNEIVSLIKEIGGTGFMTLKLEEGNYILRARSPEGIFTVKKHSDELVSSPFLGQV